LGLSLTAYWLFEPSNWLLILEVAFGLGMVIFVHELGHFAVAKACGVKCEKFFLGFDIYGLKFFSHRWGETEYGIGILPLGGYVKMLGQDDNPSNSADERERSMQEPEVLDPRSYPAQSVPKRMAIISAGVIMNVIFAFVLAAIAYSMGLKETPCIVGTVIPGQAAWQAGIRPGDKILEIGDARVTRFRDLMNSVVLSSGAVRFVIERPGVKDPITVMITPDDTKGRPTIGVTNPLVTTLAPGEPLGPVWDKALAAELKPKDHVVAVDGQPVDSYLALNEQFDRHVNEPVKLTIVRSEQDVKDAKPAGDQGSRLTVTVPPRPMLELGVVMRAGKISALRSGGPAAAAGVRVGDRLVKVDGEPVGDPLRLPERLAQKAGQTVKLSLERDSQPVELEIKQLSNFVFSPSYFEDEPIDLPTLGLAYPIENEVVAVDSAAASQLKPGEKIEWAKIVSDPKEPKPGDDKKIEFTEKSNWPVFFTILQTFPAGTKVQLGLSGGRTVTIASTVAKDWFNPDRGLRFDADSYTQVAHSFGEAMSLAGRETKESVGQVYGFLRQLFARKISVSNLAGPGRIPLVAGAAATAGLAEFLRFLCMLSANLAVLNFLPIPVLDGGHMAFLLMEGIRGKPVSERVIVAFHYAGFVFIIGLMVLVIGMDIQWWLQRLGFLSG
jgi:regulator of sigma E protease